MVSTANTATSTVGISASSANTPVRRMCSREPSVFDRLEGDETVFEKGPLEGLARDRQLAVWKHDGFWMAMDTLRDKTQLEEMWASGRAPWKTWEPIRG